MKKALCLFGGIAVGIALTLSVALLYPIEGQELN